MRYQKSRSPLIFVLTLYLALSASAAFVIAQQPSQTRKPSEPADDVIRAMRWIASAPFDRLVSAINDRVV